MSVKEIPVKITFRNMEPSPAVEEKVREAARKLATFHDRIVGCEVSIDHSVRRHQGNLFHVRVDVKVPGADISISRSPEADHTHEDAYVAIHDAFDAARRRIHDFVEKGRDAARAHG